MIRLGALCWPQSSDWKALGEAGVRAERIGYDSLWTWDHLLPVSGSPHAPIFEGWLTLAAWAATTRRVRIGLMVGATMFRNPALVAKLATTLDHISGGRAVLGVGAGWYEREHRAYGLAFGNSPGDRLRRLEEAIGIMRGMLDGDAPSGDRFSAVEGVRNVPPPLQPRLPILVGGAGERRTLRIVARYADAWNVRGDVERVRRKDAVLRGHCAAVGRDPAEIERTVATGVVVIRDDEREARRVFRDISARNGLRGWYRWRRRLGKLVPREQPRMWNDRLVGTPEQIAARLAPYVETGFRHFTVGFPAPYDPETMERLATEVRPVLMRVPTIRETA